MEARLIKFARFMNASEQLLSIPDQSIVARMSMVVHATFPLFKEQHLDLKEAKGRIHTFSVLNRNDGVYGFEVELRKIKERLPNLGEPAYKDDEPVAERSYMNEVFALKSEQLKLAIDAYKYLDELSPANRVAICVACKYVFPKAVENMGLDKSKTHEIVGLEISKEDKDTFVSYMNSDETFKEAKAEKVKAHVYMDIDHFQRGETDA